MMSFTIQLTSDPDGNDKEVEEKARRLLGADDAYGVLFDLQQHLRQEQKHIAQPKQIDNYLTKLRSVFQDLLYEHGINLDRDYS